jgi:16S rRNA A1518/A1519 N6-dimethyltransferase RsmA/KsgA/DIM1 with predicted DNA glycosylase/AP lyase activity
MADKLRENMSKYSNVTIREGDFLSMATPSGKYKIFSNIPFHLSSLIIHKITESTNPPDVAYLIVQKQFAEKLVPSANRFTGQLGILIGPEFTVSIRRRLKKTDFWPHPNVDTVFIEIKHRANQLIDSAKMPTYRKYVIGCFSDPKLFAKTPRDRVGLPSGIKPSQMTLLQWIELFLNDISYK